MKGCISSDNIGVQISCTVKGVTPDRIPSTIPETVTILFTKSITWLGFHFVDGSDVKSQLLIVLTSTLLFKALCLSSASSWNGRLLPNPV